MTETTDRVEAFYDGRPEHVWHRLERHPIEHALTLRSLREYLPPVSPAGAAPVRVCDIGGGVGRYSIELTRQGYRVTLVDLSSRCLEFARAKAEEAGLRLAEVVQGDALSLASIADEQFDAVLLMGPLYHLLKRQQRLAAVREARRLLRRDGVLVATFLNRYSILQFAAVDEPDYVLARREQCDAILATGVHRRPKGYGGFIDAYFSHPSEVRPLMEEAGLISVDLLACEPLVNELDEKMPLGNEALRQRWTDVLWQVARDPCVLGACGHLLYVGRRKG